MRRPVEVAGTQPLEHVGDGVLAQQHAAEDRLFGRGVLRRLATEVLTRWGVHAWMTTGTAQVVNDSHGASHLPCELFERVFDTTTVTVGHHPDVHDRARRPLPATAHARRC